MELRDKGSVTHWIEGLREGDSVAAQELWNRYFARLASIAQTRLAHLARESDGEDVALSALKSVMIGVQQQRFPDLSDRDSLWPLLVTIAARKSISEQRRQMAHKRSRCLECSNDDLREHLGAEPSPAFALEVVDEFERLMRELKEPTLRRVVELKLGGCQNDEIADTLGCAVRTVIRKLKLIRQEWRNTWATETDEESPE